MCKRLPSLDRTHKFGWAFLQQLAGHPQNKRDPSKIPYRLLARRLFEHGKD